MTAKSRIQNKLLNALFHYISVLVFMQYLASFGYGKVSVWCIFHEEQENELIQEMILLSWAYSEVLLFFPRVGLTFLIYVDFCKKNFIYGDKKSKPSDAYRVLKRSSIKKSSQRTTPAEESHYLKH